LKGVPVELLKNSNFIELLASFFSYPVLREPALKVAKELPLPMITTIPLLN
jgi:hypothetical protein